MGWPKTGSEVPLFSELLPYLSADTNEDVIWLKDGSATSTFELVPRTAGTLTEDDLELLRQGLTPLLDQVPDDALLQLYVLREPTQEGSDTAARNWLAAHEDTANLCGLQAARSRLLTAKRQMLDALWGERKIYQTRVYVTLRIPPDASPRPGARQGPLAHLAFWHQNKRGQPKGQAEILSDLNQAVATLRSGLEGSGFETLNVPMSARVELIYRFLNPDRAKLLAPPEPTSSVDMSDRLTLTDFLETEAGLRLGRTRLLIGSLKSLPEITVPALMEGLSAFPAPFALVVTVLFLPQTAERERLLRRQRLAQGMASGNHVRNLLAENQLRDIEDTLSAMIASGQKLVSASFHLISLEE